MIPASFFDQGFIIRENKGDIKLSEIAEQLGLPPNKVRKWKSLDKWDEISIKKQVERSTKNKWSAPPKKQVERSTKGKVRSSAKIADNLIAEELEENGELTQKQKDFCLYFMQNRNATQAYFKSHNCSYNTANTNGPALLVNTRIKEELKRLRKIALSGYR